ncbi:hypothetical protein OG331_48830 [Streptomyces sp. NBC_01017]|uniref:hypothetical protein n=1 Tax=Streptomyces sp. NBC_01017 TaxID=2903721 RepID=UPI003865391A|nr:hypothetical protein OG331_03145 [Streptomyces sp. NBC_01017]WSV34926.1 hypothetical protein OG331_48830 [Streptomyces sp. NBC_01017]
MSGRRSRPSSQLGATSKPGPLGPGQVDRYHSFRTGSDLRVVVVDGHAVGAEVRTSIKGFKSNPALGGTAEPCLGRYLEAEQLACRAAATVGAEIAGVDLLFESSGAFTICEVNTAPGTKVLTEVTPAIIAACSARVRRVDGLPAEKGARQQTVAACTG